MQETPTLKKKIQPPQLWTVKFERGSRSTLSTFETLVSARTPNLARKLAIEKAVSAGMDWTHSAKASIHKARTSRIDEAENEPTA